MNEIEFNPNYFKVTDKDKEKVAEMLGYTENNPLQMTVNDYLNQQMKDQDLVFKTWFIFNGERIEQETGVTSLQDLIDRLNSIRKLEDENYDLKEKAHHLELALERKEKEYMILEDSYHCRIKDWEELCKGTNKLEKALDNACEVLFLEYMKATHDDAFPTKEELKQWVFQDRIFENDEEDEWKEWCLKDERTNDQS